MKNLVILLISTFIFAGCASEPITVLRTSYGEVISEQSVTKSKSNGLATVGGAAIGGLLGNQVGGGRGKTVATVAGAVAGGAAGHQVSKTEEVHYQYIVHMDGGEKFILETKTKRQPIGAKVVVENLSNGRERINVLP